MCVSASAKLKQVHVFKCSECMYYFDGLASINSYSIL